jgi:hypothetical protein
MLWTMIAPLRLGLVGLLLFPSVVFAQGSKVTINSDLVLEVNGKKTFPIGFTMPPAPDAKAPGGRPAFEEWRDAGATFFRTGPSNKVQWDEWLPTERKYMDVAAKHGMYTLPWLKELAHIEEGAAKKEEQLRKLVNEFKDHPGLGCWKGDDEPEWGKKPIPPLKKAYDVVKELDPNHPMWIVQAPQGTVDSMRRYAGVLDITGQDVYPISYPPGIHSNLKNTEISLVGDHARLMQDVTLGKQPVWMTLQISWSGVVKEGRTLRMPTFHEQRYMTYHSIVNGSRGIIYFGGHNKEAMPPRDVALGWNWTYWENVLKRVVLEIGDKSPLFPALVAPASEMKVTVKHANVEFTQAKQVEFIVREAGDDVFLIACKRDPGTILVRFDGLPASATEGEVIFEAPRKVKLDGKGTFHDWFAPYEVHVYRFRRANAG